jgi:hypothetical protein
MDPAAQMEQWATLEESKHSLDPPAGMKLRGAQTSARYRHLSNDRRDS